MKIALDLDGVLADFMAVVRQWEGIPHDMPQTDWTFSNWLTSADWDKIWDKIRNTRNFWETVPGYEENIQVLSDWWLKNYQTDIHFVTSRSDTLGETTMAQTTYWLRTRGLWPRGGHSSVSVVKQPSQKYRIMGALDIPFSLDDKPETVKDCDGRAGHRSFLLDRPWNQNFPGKLNRVKSVAEYLDIVSGNQ